MRDMCAYRVSSFGLFELALLGFLSSFELLREDGFDTLTFVKIL